MLPNIMGVMGWIGTASYLIAYLLLSLNRLRPNQVPYHLLNLIGAFGLMLNAIYLKDHPNMAVNIIWGLIALVSIFAMIWKK